MRICYIKQAKNLDEYINYTSKIKNKFIKDIIMKFKMIFNIITVKPFGDSIIFIVAKNNKIKIAKKIIRKLKYYNINDVVLENKLHIDDFKNTLYENNINILDGRWLFNYLIIDIMKYITELKQEKLENQEISVLVNDLTDVSTYNIYELAEKVKRLNIITNNIDKFKNIENKLYKEKGIMITVSNNKRKSLVKTKMILNIDFPEDLINKYNINNRAILVNVENEVKINSKTFNGININFYNIKIKDEITNKFKDNNIYDEFNKNILYESIVYNKIRYQTIKEKIKKDEIVIDGLIGGNGQIDKKEFQKIHKNT